MDEPCRKIHGLCVLGSLVILPHHLPFFLQTWMSVRCWMEAASRAVSTPLAPSSASAGRDSGSTPTDAPASVRNSHILPTLGFLQGQKGPRLLQSEFWLNIITHSGSSSLWGFRYCQALYFGFRVFFLKVSHIGENSFARSLGGFKWQHILNSECFSFVAHLPACPSTALGLGGFRGCFQGCDLQGGVTCVCLCQWGHCGAQPGHIACLCGEEQPLCH